MGSGLSLDAYHMVDSILDEQDALGNNLEDSTHVEPGIVNEAVS